MICGEAIFRHSGLTCHQYSTHVRLHPYSCNRSASAGLGSKLAENILQFNDTTLCQPPETEIFPSSEALIDDKVQCNSLKDDYSDPCALFATPQWWQLSCSFVDTNLAKMNLNTIPTQRRIVTYVNAKNPEQLYQLILYIEEMDGLECRWEESSVNIEAKATLYWYQNPIAVLQYILRHPLFMVHLSCTPVEKMNSCGERIYPEISTADLLWKTQASIVVFSERLFLVRFLFCFNKIECQREHVREIMPEKSYQRDCVREIVSERSHLRDHVWEIVSVRLFERDHVREIVSKRSRQSDHVQVIISNSLCQTDCIREIMSERSCQRDPVWEIMSERSCRRDPVKEIMSGRSCQRDPVREILSEKSCQRDPVREILTERSCQRNPVREILSERSCQRDPVREIMSERLYQDEFIRGIVSERLCQRNYVREIVSGRRCQREHVRERVRELVTEHYSHIVWEQMSDSLSEIAWPFHSVSTCSVSSVSALVLTGFVMIL